MVNFDEALNEDKPPVRYRRVEPGEYPEGPIIPGPYGDPVVLQWKDSAGGWHDVPLEDIKDE